MSRTRTSALAAALVAAALTVITPATSHAAGKKITVQWPASSQVVVDTPTALTGKVKDRGRVRRPVLVEQKFADGWADVHRTRTRADGTWSAPLPTTWHYNTPVRVTAPAFRGHPAAASATKRIAVVPNYQPLGPKNAWVADKDFGTNRVRWNPCKPITYRLNLTAAPAGAAAAVQHGMTLLHQATGITFKNKGATAAVPWPSRAVTAKRNKDTDIVIAWAHPSQTTQPFGPGVAVAWGGSMKGVWARDAKGKLVRPTHGGVVIDANTPVDYAGNVHLVMHEVGHVLGLDHAEDRGQHMVSGFGFLLPLQWGAGDLTGLAQAGRQAGCVTDQ